MPHSELEPILVGGGSSAEMPQISSLLQRSEQDTKNFASTILLCGADLKSHNLLDTQRFDLAARTTCVPHGDIFLTFTTAET